MALARSGRIEFAEYFRLLDAMRDEREGAVWQQVIENLEYLDDVFAGIAGAGICPRLWHDRCCDRSSSAWGGSRSQTRMREHFAFAMP